MLYLWYQFNSAGVTANKVISHIHAMLALLSRVYIAQVFFLAGLTKIRDWDTTLFLFEEEYQVPGLSYQAAAWLGTGGEIVLPLLLLIGLFSRFAALGLFVVNLVAVISLPDIAQAALNLHIIWALLIAQILVYGSGKLSVDQVAFSWLKNPARKQF